MNFTIRSNTGNNLTGNISVEENLNTTKLRFNFIRSSSSNWDIDFMSLDCDINENIVIETSRGNVLENDNIISRQLITIALPLLQVLLYTRLSATEQAQISSFSVNTFSKKMPEEFKNLNSYIHLQLYKDKIYEVFFVKDYESTHNNMGWRITEIKRKLIN